MKRKHCKNQWITVLLSCLLYATPAYAQIEEGRPVVILLTPESVFAGSLDDEQPRYQVDTIEGLFSSNQYGIFEKWFALEIVLHGVYYNGLNARPENQMLILAIPPGNSRTEWLEIVTVLFDRFSIPEIYLHETTTWDMAITPELTPGQKLYWIAGGNN